MVATFSTLLNGSRKNGQNFTSRPFALVWSVGLWSSLGADSFPRGEGEGGMRTCRTRDTALRPNRHSPPDPRVELHRVDGWGRSSTSCRVPLESPCGVGRPGSRTEARKGPGNEVGKGPAWVRCARSAHPSISARTLRNHKRSEPAPCLEAWRPSLPRPSTLLPLRY